MVVTPGYTPWITFCATRGGSTCYRTHWIKTMGIQKMWVKWHIVQCRQRPSKRIFRDSHFRNAWFAFFLAYLRVKSKCKLWDTTGDFVEMDRFCSAISFYNVHTHYCCCFSVRMLKGTKINEQCLRIVMTIRIHTFVLGRDKCWVT